VQEDVACRGGGGGRGRGGSNCCNIGTPPGRGRLSSARTLSSTQGRGTGAGAGVGLPVEDRVLFSELEVGALQPILGGRQLALGLGERRAQRIRRELEVRLRQQRVSRARLLREWGSCTVRRALLL